MQTLRYADPETVTQYPLNIPAEIDWCRGEDAWQAMVPLPDLPAGHIIAPSLSVLGEADYRFRFTLIASGAAYPLLPVPAPPGPAAAPTPDSPGRRVRTAIDCFHTENPVTGVTLVAECFRAQPPGRYLLTVSTRPTELRVEAPPSLATVRAAIPPARSQLLENPRIARRICSPVSTAMVLQAHGVPIHYARVIAACLDPVTGMYGMWPLAVHTASRYGLAGAVELLDGWEPVLDCLDRGLPLVASIRYAKGELPGAPQTATGGHLVVVHGVDGDQVLVNDPAAPHHGTVSRRYPLAAFTRVWFRYRGAAYILSP